MWFITITWNSTKKAQNTLIIFLWNEYTHSKPQKTSLTYSHLFFAHLFWWVACAKKMPLMVEACSSCLPKTLFLVLAWFLTLAVEVSFSVFPLILQFRWITEQYLKGHDFHYFVKSLWLSSSHMCLSSYSILTIEL